MFRILLRAVAALALGALSALAAAGDPDQEPAACTGCRAGVGNAHQVFTMTDDNGDICFLTATWWRAAGSCKLVETSDGTCKCVTRLPCRYIIQTHCTCGSACQNMSVQVSTLDGSLNFTMGAQATYLVAAPQCGWSNTFVVNVFNNATGETTWQIQTANCSRCELIDGACGGGKGSGKGDGDGDDAVG